MVNFSTKKRNPAKNSHYYFLSVEQTRILRVNLQKNKNCKNRTACKWDPMYMYFIVIFLPPANVFCEGCVFTGVCLSTEGGIPARRPRGRRPP